MTDYYKTLGVSPQSTEEEIKKAFRSKARQCHPDSHPDHTGYAEQFKNINEAYETLGDREKRKKYDEAQAAQSAGNRQKAENRNRNPRENQSSATGDMSAFEQFFGFQPGKAAEPREANQCGAEGAKGPMKPEEMFASFFGKIKQ